MRHITSKATARVLRVGLSAGWVVLTAAHPAWAADDVGAQSLHRHQLQRQQQQESLQLRMHQQQHRLQNPAADGRQKHAVERLQVDQQVRQQQLHYRQQIEPPAVQPADDDGTRHAKERIEREKAQRQSQQQLRRFEAGYDK